LGEGPVVVGADGTIYVGANPLGLDTYVVAVSPEGTILWRFVECCSQGLIAGPAVGPDGNIYAVGDQGGLGAFALSPSGELLWNDIGVPDMWEYGQIGAEIVFGPSEQGGPVDQLYLAFDRRSDSHLWGFDLEGNQQFAVPTGGTYDPFSQVQAQPAVGLDGMVLLSEFNSVTGWGLQAFSPGSGDRIWRFDDNGGIVSGMSPPDAGPDGTIYFAADLSKVFSLEQNGTERWMYPESGIIDEGPVVSPRNDVLVYGGRPTFGVPGFFKAVTTWGDEAWQIDLPAENGGSVVPATRATFTPDGVTAYIGALILADPEDDTYSYLYATNAATEFDLTLTHTVLVRGQQAIFTVSGAVPGETVYFLYSLAGTGEGPCPPQIGGLCLDLLEPITIFGSTMAAGPDGTAEFVITVPLRAPLRDVSTQAVVRRGTGGSQSVKSNPVTAALMP
jgi:outer membrane protein assembly factor BamB